MNPRKILDKIAPNWHPTRYAPLRRLIMSAVTLLRSETMEVKHGFRLRIPKTDRSPYVLPLFLHREYEPEESRLIADHLGPGDIAFDIGANVGYMTCLMARRVAGSTGGQVHAFEPEKTNYRLLCENVALNGFTNATANRLAIGPTTEQQFLFLANENRGDHTLVKIPGRSAQPIDVVSFDEYRLSHCPGRIIRFVKIDVQGYEFEVLKGMRNSLAESAIDFVLLEFTPARVKMMGTPSSALPEFAGDFPYDATIVSAVNAREYSSLDEISAACPHLEADPYASFNLLLAARTRSR